MENTFDLKKFLVENKLTNNSRILSENETITPEKAVDTAEKISDNLSQNPEQLKQALAKAQQAGISMDIIKQAASQLKQGKSPEELLKSVSNQVQEELDEASVADAKKKELWSSLTQGAMIGAAIPTATIPLIAAGTGLAIGLPVLIPIAIVALAGALLAASFRDKSSGGEYTDAQILTAAAWEFKNQMLDQDREKYGEPKRRNSLPDLDLFYIVDNGDTPKELQGKEIWRFTKGDRDAVGDKKALYASN